MEDLLMVKISVCEWGYGREGDRCVACPAGSFANSDTPTCEPCPAGSTTIIKAGGQCSTYLM